MVEPQSLVGILGWTTKISSDGGKFTKSAFKKGDFFGQQTGQHFYGRKSKIVPVTASLPAAFGDATRDSHAPVAEEFPWMLRGVEWMSRPALVQAARHRRAKPA